MPKIIDNLEIRLMEEAKKQIEDEIKGLIGEQGRINTAEYAHEVKDGYVNVNARIETIESAGEKIIINQ